MVPPSLPARPAPARLPLLLLVLALPSLCVGFLGVYLAVTDLSGALLGRTAAVERVREFQLALYDARRLVPPLQQLPRAEAERLALQFGAERHERRGVTVPLALLSLLCSWLLLTGAMGALRRHGPALSLWRWACLVNIPLSMLTMLVTLVRARELMDRLGPQVAEALARSSGRPAAVELEELWALARLYVTGWGLLHGLWVLWLGLTVLYLRRLVPVVPASPR